MRLIVEPPRALRESYSGAPPNGALSQGRVLAVRVERQKQDRWCWAAIAVSLGAWYGARAASSQECLVAAVLGASDGDRNQNAQLDDALRAAGCFSHWSPGRPEFQRIAGEIEAGRPLCPCIEWRRGGTHYVVISGYCLAEDRRELYVDDPMVGPSLQRYDDFPGQYRLTGGFWRGVFWTAPRQDALGEHP